MSTHKLRSVYFAYFHSRLKYGIVFWSGVVKLWKCFSYRKRWFD